MATLHNIVRRLVERVDGPPVNLTHLEDENVTGFIIDRPMSVIQALEQLQQVYSFDVEETTGVLRFVTRKRRITQELVEHSGTLGGIQRDRVQEVEVPRSVSLTFTDASKSPDFGTVIAQRSLVPTFETVDSHQRQDIKVFIALEAGQARQIAQATLLAAWSERDRFTFILPPSSLLLNPTDHIEVETENGRRFNARIINASVGADRTVEVTAVAYGRRAAADIVDDSSSISVNSDDDIRPGSLGAEAEDQNTAAPGQLLMLNLPGLRDEELIDQQGVTSVGYAGLVQHTGAGLSPVVVEREDGGGLWTPQINIPTQASPILTGWLTANVPRNPGTAGYNRSRRRDTCDVLIDSVRNHAPLFDRVVTVSDEDWINGVNRIAIIKQGDASRAGRIGIIAFKEVARLLNSSGDGYHSLRLTGMIRGMRGTELMDRDYQEGDFVVFLPPGENSSLPWLSVLDGDFGNSRAYRARFRSYEAPAVDYEHQPMALLPYAPFNIRATLEADLSTTITWTRRARFGGEDDLTLGDEEIPIGEQDLVGNDYERYDIRLVIPTHDVDVEVEDLEGPSYSYPLEDKVAAGYNAADPEPVAATVTVWQKSAVLEPGRGFPGRANVEI